MKQKIAFYGKLLQSIELWG